MIQNGVSEVVTGHVVPMELDASLPLVVTSADDGLIDETLAQVALSAVQTGSITPLVKEELKCTIQTKRLSEGKDELAVEFELPTQEELTPEEEERRRRRRERNKLAAQKCRSKKREKADELNQESLQLEALNEELKKEIRKLEAEKTQLRQMLCRHDKSTQCDRRMSDSEA